MADELASDPSADAQAKADLEAIPKLPYARGIRLSWREIMRILMLVGTLVLLLVMQKPCAHAVSAFVTGFDVGSGSAAASGSGAASGSAAGSGTMVHLPAGMTDQQMKQTIDRARGSAAP